MPSKTDRGQWVTNGWNKWHDFAQIFSPDLQSEWVNVSCRQVKASRQVSSCRRWQIKKKNCVVYDGHRILIFFNSRLIAVAQKHTFIHKPPATNWPKSGFDFKQRALNSYRWQIEVYSSLSELYLNSNLCAIRSSQKCNWMSW